MSDTKKLPRYFITSPVPGGYAYWNICDREGVDGQPNFALVSIWKGTPGAVNLIKMAFAALISNDLEDNPEDDRI